jgi:adenosylcobinamide-GDP ribazoletransferase
MRKLLNRFLSVMALVSRVPVFGTKSPPDYAFADLFLPFAGLFAAAFTWVGAAAASLAFPREPLLAAICALSLQYLGFNLFHLDGLLDSADALLPFTSRERRFEILKDPRIGAYGFACGFFALAAKLALLAAAARELGAASLGFAACLAYPVVGRAACSFVPLVSRPAKPEGLGSLMGRFSAFRWALGFGIALSPFAAFAFADRGMLSGIVLVFASAAAAAAVGGAVAFSFARKLGGFTGDALGAAVELGELVFLAAISAIRAIR